MEKNKKKFLGMTNFDIILVAIFGFVYGYIIDCARVILPLHLFLFFAVVSLVIGSLYIYSVMKTVQKRFRELMK